MRQWDLQLSSTCRRRSKPRRLVALRRGLPLVDARVWWRRRPMNAVSVALHLDRHFSRSLVVLFCSFTCIGDQRHVVRCRPSSVHVVGGILDIATSIHRGLVGLLLSTETALCRAMQDSGSPAHFAHLSAPRGLYTEISGLEQHQLALVAEPSLDPCLWVVPNNRSTACGRGVYPSFSISNQN